MHCLFFFPSPLPVLFNSYGCEQHRRVYEVNKLGISNPFVSASLETRLSALLRGCEPGNPSRLTAPRPPSSQGPELWASLGGGLPQGEERSSLGMKQNVSNAMNWTSVSSEKKKEKKSSALMRDAKIFWYVDKLPPAPHSWNKHAT